MFRENPKALSRISSEPVFCEKFISTVVDLPLSVLLRSDQYVYHFLHFFHFLREGKILLKRMWLCSLNVNVCECVPYIRLTGDACSFSFIVDTTKFSVNEINNDGLGLYFSSFFTFNKKKKSVY